MCNFYSQNCLVKYVPFENVFPPDNIWLPQFLVIIKIIALSNGYLCLYQLWERIESGRILKKTLFMMCDCINQLSQGKRWRLCPKVFMLLQVNMALFSHAKNTPNGPSYFLPRAEFSQQERVTYPNCWSVIYYVCPNSTDPPLVILYKHKEQSIATKPERWYVLSGLLYWIICMVLVGRNKSK